MKKNSGENYLAYFFCGFQGENEKFTKIIAGSSCGFAAQFHAHSYTATLLVLVLQGEPARRLIHPINCHPEDKC